jgi:hypothetical protein
VGSFFESFEQNLTSMMRAIQQKTYEFHKGGWSGDDADVESTVVDPWNFFSSLLFSITITTTIGRVLYHHR